VTRLFAGVCGFVALMALMGIQAIVARGGFIRVRIRNVVRHVLSVISTQLDRYVFIDRAGVCLFFRHSQFGEPL